MEQQNMRMLADYIDLLCQNISIHKIDNSALKIIFEEIEQGYTRPKEGYSLLQGTDAVAAFLLNNWTFRESIEENLDNLSVLSTVIRNTFIVPSGRQITERSILTMLTLADDRFSILKRFLLHNPIDILLVNNTCRYANALYYFNSNPRAKIKDNIVLTWDADDKVCPEFAFLHELGHMVHTRITQKSFVAPKSFEIVHPIILKYSPQDFSKPIVGREKKLLARWFAEWFAECFAIAVLHRSPYSHLDYHTEIEDDDKDSIKAYMTVLLDTLEYNKLGKRTWEKLK